MINKETIKTLIKDIDGVFESDVINGGRSGNNPLARFAISYILREVLDCTYEHVGELIGKGHSHAQKYVRRHYDLIKFDKEYIALFNKIQLDDYKSLVGGLNMDYIRNYVKHFKDKIEYYNNEVRELKRLKSRFYPSHSYKSRVNKAL